MAQTHTIFYWLQHFFLTFHNKFSRNFDTTEMRALIRIRETIFVNRYYLFLYQRLLDLNIFVARNYMPAYVTNLNMEVFTLMWL